MVGFFGGLFKKKKKEGLSLKVDTSAPAKSLADTDFSKFGGTPSNVPQDFTKGKNADLSPENLATLNQRKFNQNVEVGAETQEGIDLKSLEDRVFGRGISQRRDINQRQAVSAEGLETPEAQESLILDARRKSFLERAEDFKKSLELSPQNIASDPVGTLAPRGVAGAVVGAGAAVGPSLGLVASAKTLATGAGVVMGTDALATWLAADNFQSSIPFQLNDVQGALEEGTISPQEAAGLYDQAEEQVRQADTFINTSTRINPFLWPARKRYAAQSNNVKRALELKRLRAQV